ncbi:MAG: hypothetical protein LBK66_14610 [Spirochaetaceae bacterium]|jgi:hypothetical protein|nr:hypothetical protein [Spirochaetaceae bacterium]
MGMSSESLRMMCFAAKNGTDFSKTVTIGRQLCLIPKEELNKILSDYNPGYKDSHEMKELNKIYYKDSCQYAEPLFEYFGAKTTDSIDISNYENATIIQDMCAEIDDSLKNKYTCVWDGGALEHIFRFPTAIKNCMELVKPSGHLILETPGNNWFGHGFYQFSPELFFSLLDKQNGFAGTRIFMQNDMLNWYEAIPPKTLGMRTGTCCSVSRSMLMHIVSQKISDTPDTINAYQSDYQAAWTNNDPVDKNAIIGSNLRLLHKIRCCIPKFLLPAAWWLWNNLCYFTQISKSYTRDKYFENPNGGGGGDYECILEFCLIYPQRKWKNLFFGGYYENKQYPI